MSYDMGIADKSFNYTYNVTDMWYDCYPDKGIREHYGLTGREAIPVLRKLRDHMEDHSIKLRHMEPDNGWGDFDGALKFVNELVLASSENPSSVWSGD